MELLVPLCENTLVFLEILGLPWLTPPVPTAYTWSLGTSHSSNGFNCGAAAWSRMKGHDGHLEMNCRSCIGNCTYFTLVFCWVSLAHHVSR